MRQIFTFYISYCYALKGISRSTYNVISHVFPHLIKYNQKFISQIVKLLHSFLGVPTLLYLILHSQSKKVFMILMKQIFTIYISYC